MKLMTSPPSCWRGYIASDGTQVARDAALFDPLTELYTRDRMLFVSLGA